VQSPPAPAVVAPEPSPAELAARARGWGYLIDRLEADGLPRERAAAAFSDERVPAFDGLLFSPAPRESRAQYRGLLKRRSVEAAERCAAAHADALEAAERATGVSASVVAAILHVESHCGANTGKAIVLYRLARLAMANEPQNVARNLSRWTGPDGVIDPASAEALRARARYLEDVFYPEVRATFAAADRMGVDPLDIRGSSAGAFGLPQFLPGSFVAFGSDGDGDGRVSLYEPADAAASAARFLASYGWRPGLTRAQKRQVIWHYNRSDAYIDTVLALAARIDHGGALRVSLAAPAATALPATRHP
jgi:membrane-bound lytic murein transglycosylase B